MARSLYLLAIGLASLTITAAQTEQIPLNNDRKPKNPFHDDFKSFVKEVMDEWHMPGLAISVVDGDETFTDAFGYATVPDVEATPDTLWYVGSTTKAHVTATLADLIASGQYKDSFPLGWKTPISHILAEDFVMSDDWATKHLTLEDAASHRTGLTRHDFSVTYDEDHHEHIMRDTVRNLRNLPMTLEPRTKFSYNNLMFTVLGHVIETITGDSLEAALKNGHWGSLGLNASFVDYEKARKSSSYLSTGYYWNTDNSSFVSMPYTPTAAMNAAGAVISNVKDYAKWVHCLLNECSALLPETHREIKTARTIDAPDGSQGSGLQTYTLGWWKTTLYGEDLIWHSGGTGTHATLVYFFPKRGFGVTMFTNSVVRAVGGIMYRLVEERFGVPEEKRWDYLEGQRKSKKQATELKNNATSILYPTAPSQALPPALNLTSYTGTYRSKGYGDLTFHLSEDNNLDAIAEKKEWPQLIRLVHVSGEYWAVFSIDHAAGDEVRAFFKGWFTIGEEGKVNKLEIEMWDRLDDVYEGVIAWEKIEE